MILEKLLNAKYRRRRVRFKKLIAEIYPDVEDRGYAMLSEGAEIFNIVCFNEGDPLKKITITADEDERYHIKME